MHHEYAAARTTPITRILKKGPRGATAAFDPTGMTVALVARDRYGNALGINGVTEWSSGATSEAKFSPASGDLVPFTRMYVRWEVTDLLGKVSPFPGGEEAEEWVIGA